MHPSLARAVTRRKAHSGKGNNFLLISFKSEIERNLFNKQFILRIQVKWGLSRAMFFQAVSL